MRIFDCSQFISQADWDKVKHEDIFIDHNGDPWRAVYIDRNSKLHGITVARPSENARREVTIFLHYGQVKTLTADAFSEPLIKRTKRVSGTYPVALAA